MENLETEKAQSVQQTRSKKPAVIVCVVLAIVLIAYLVLCCVVSSGVTFYPNTTLNGVDIGGLTAEEAAQMVESNLTSRDCNIYLGDEDTDSRDPDTAVTLGDLGIQPTGEYLSGSQSTLALQRDHSLFAAGACYLKSLLGGNVWQLETEFESSAFNKTVDDLIDTFNFDAQDTVYTIGDNSISITAAKDGQRVEQSVLTSLLQKANTWEQDCRVIVPMKVLPAKTMTAQAIYDEVSAEVKNAGYDVSTGKITPEQIGAEFDVSAAKTLLDNAQPGETIEVPATIERPAVTAQQLSGVLFRDVLGTAKTHVGGTAARINNVKLASSSVNGTVLNCGDVFSYNGTVGQRTAAKGYQAAPAYVQGETVDEIGGGVCQPSSTLYLACLNSNLEITERYAHRYAPTYISHGMDATVSWGGPDYKFTNNTNYPIKIVATYDRGYLTMKLLGTKVDGTYVKMTKETLSTTEFKTITQEDPMLAPGTQVVKVTPYTGYKVNSYRNIYSADGSLISSKLEAVSNYKARDKVILVGPKKAEETAPSDGSSSSETTAPVETPAQTPSETPAETPVETPAQTPAVNTGEDGYTTPAA